MEQQLKEQKPQVGIELDVNTHIRMSEKLLNIVNIFDT